MNEKQKQRSRSAGILEVGSDSVPFKDDLVANPLYYTGSIDEGFGNIEVVSELDTQNEDELYIASPLKDFDLSTYRSQDASLPSSSQSLTDKERNNKRDEFRTLYRTTYYDDSTSSSSDESDVYNLLKIISDDETRLSYSSSASSESDNPNKGNMPNFDQLDVPNTVATHVSIPVFPNPLLSRRTPTATVPFNYEEHSPEIPVTDSKESSATLTRKKESPKFPATKSPVLFPYSNLSSSIMPVAANTTAYTVEHLESQTSKHFEKRTQPRIYRVNDTYCSAGTQSALFGKLTTDSEPSDLSTVSPLTSPGSSTEAGEKSNQPVKRRSSKRLKTDARRSSFEQEVERDFRKFEAEVGKAFEESVSEGSMMPLLKQELQCKIQVRRLSRGEPELVLEHEEPKKYELTPEEVQKKEMRLFQNRRSANKSRLKAKQYMEVLQTAVKDEMTKHARLQGEMAALVKYRNKLKVMHDLHMRMCKQTSEKS